MSIEMNENFGWRSFLQSSKPDETEYSVIFQGYSRKEEKG